MAAEVSALRGDHGRGLGVAPSHHLSRTTAHEPASGISGRQCPGSFAHLGSRVLYGLTGSWRATACSSHWAHAKRCVGTGVDWNRHRSARADIQLHRDDIGHFVNRSRDRSSRCAGLRVDQRASSRSNDSTHGLIRDGS
jgi:hypothetical protein